MAAYFFEYFMDFMAMLVIAGAAYYWYQVSKIDVPLPADGEVGDAANLGGVMTAVAEITRVIKRAAGYTALGAILFAGSWAMGVFANAGG